MRIKILSLLISLLILIPLVTAIPPYTQLGSANDFSKTDTTGLLITQSGNATSGNATTNNYYNNTYYITNITNNTYINEFDQSLNTTDNVIFKTITINHTGSGTVGAETALVINNTDSWVRWTMDSPLGIVFNRAKAWLDIYFGESSDTGNIYFRGNNTYFETNMIVTGNITAGNICYSNGTNCDANSYITNITDTIDGTFAYKNDSTGIINMTAFDKRYMTGGVRIYWFTNQTNAAGNKNMSLTIPTDPESEITYTLGDNDEHEIASFITQTVNEEVVYVAGMRNLFLKTKVDDTNREVLVYARVYLCEGYNTTADTCDNLISYVNSTYYIESTVDYTEYQLSYYVGNIYTLNTTNRFMVKVYAQKIEGGTTNINLAVDDMSYSRIQVPSPVGVTDVNVNSTQFESSNPITISLLWLESFIDSIAKWANYYTRAEVDGKFINVTMNNQSNEMYGNITLHGNLSADYLIANQYLMGQPLTGMLGSGLIQTQEGTNYISGVNLTCTGLTCTYNNFTVRLASTTSQAPAIYCKIPAGTLTATDNTFSAYYIDSNCAVQSTTYDTWYTTILGKSQAWDFAHVLAHNGNVETSDTISLEQRRLAKMRVLTYYLDQMKVVSGFNFRANAFPSFNITSGKTVFGMDVVDINQKNVTATMDEIELVGHNSSTTWRFDDQRGINITSCDNGTAIVACTGTNYRRHFIFMVGYDDSKNAAEVHQLYPLASKDYSTLAQCLDTTTNPLTYTLPPEYTGAALMLYAYCAKRTDASWVTSSLIDLRTVKTGSATASGDTSGLVPYTGAIQNVNLDGYNISTAGVIATLVNATNVVSTTIYAANITSNITIAGVYYYTIEGSCLPITSAVCKNQSGTLYS